MPNDEPSQAGANQKPQDKQEPCDRCGQLDYLSAFSGWQHDPGEEEMLCGECHETATLEE